MNEDAVEEMGRMKEMENARKEQEKRYLLLGLFHGIFSKEMVVLLVWPVSFPDK